MDLLAIALYSREVLYIFRVKSRDVSTSVRKGCGTLPRIFHAIPLAARKTPRGGLLKRKVTVRADNSAQLFQHPMFLLLHRPIFSDTPSVFAFGATLKRPFAGTVLLS